VTIISPTPVSIGCLALLANVIWGVKAWPAGYACLGLVA